MDPLTAGVLGAGAAYLLEKNGKRAPGPVSKSGSGAADMVNRIGNLKNQYENSDVSDKMKQSGKSDINSSSGFAQVVIQTSDIPVGGNKVIELSGTELFFSVQSSTTGVQVDIDFEGGGKLVQVQPGMKIVANFGRFIVSNPSIASGAQLSFIVSKSPDNTYEELPASNGGAVRSLTLAPAANVATNIPSNPTDGISIDSSKGVRAILSTTVGQNITGGTLVFWEYDTITGLWSESSNSYEILNPLAGASRRSYSTSDYPIAVSVGRIFVEARNVTISGGTLSLVILVG